MNGLSIIDLPEAGRLARFLGKDSFEAAIVELNNTLAAVPLDQLDSASLLERVRATGVTPNVLCARLLSIYGRSLRSLIADGRIDEADEATLAGLRRLLGLSDGDVVHLHEEFIYSVYSRACAAAMRDGRLNDSERERLEALAGQLRIPEPVRKRIFVSHAEAVIQSAVNNALADGRLSPEEEAEFEILAQELDSTIRMDARSRAALERCRMLWRVSTGEVEPVDVPINLRRGEFAAARVPARQCEIRTVTVGRSSSGFTYTSKAVLGVRFRAGNVRTHAIKEDQLVTIDTGTLYFTSTRLLFDGERKTTQIPLAKIIGASFLSDGIQVEKETGRDVLFHLHGDIDFLRAVFDGLMLRSRL
ncbi:MAG: hypothetical protein IT175_12235 [Acidobacteria bacterium]|nr:hypothetical protein [Acidobacteriota bacterium]